MKRPVILFLLKLLIVTSCLDPAGENFIEIEPPDPTQITLDLSDINEDTILIDRPMRFTYQLNGYPLHTTEIDVHIGNQGVYAPTNSGNTFEVNPAKYPEGHHIMNVTITARTQNGSLADRLDEEYFEISRQFHVIIENLPPEPAEIIKLDSANGVLTIYWSKYPKQNFHRYEVTKFCFNDSYYQPCLLTTLNVQNDTSWSDPDYVGGKVAYRVDIFTYVNGAHGIRRMYDWEPKIVINLENGYATMSWSKPLYYAHSTGYHVSPGIGFPFNAALSDTSYAPPDRTYFGQKYNFDLTIVSDFEPRSAEFTKEYYVGERKFLPSVVPRLYNSKHHLYYGLGSPGLVAMDKDLNVLTSVSTRATWKISPNGEYFIAIIGSDFYKTDPLTLETTLLLQTPSVSGGNQVVADNGLIGFQTSSGYRVMDLNSGQEKYADNSTPYQNLSPSGNYLVRFRDVLRYDGTSFVFEGTLPADFGLTYMFKENDDLIASHGYPTYGLAEFDIETRTRTLLADLGTAASPLQQDPVSGKLMVLQDSWYQVFNPATGATQLVSSRFSSIFNGRFFTYQDNYVYTVEHTYIE